MGKRRQEKMTEEIKRILSRIIQEEIKDPRVDVGMVSITRVELSSDLSHARINISILGDKLKQEEAFAALKNARGYIRTELARAVKIKHAPELEFRLDNSIEHGINMSSLLDSIKRDEEKRD